MDEQKLKELLTNEMNSSAPDKEALWAKIEGRLQPKPVAEAPKKKSISLHVLKAVAAAAAAITLIFAVPAVIGSISSVPINTPSGGLSSADVTSDDNSIADDAPQDSMNEAPDHSDMNESVGSANEGISQELEKVLEYSELKFASYSETFLSCSGEPYGDSYFVEEEVLAETDRIVIAEVTRVYKSDDGESLCYELQTIHSFPETAETTITVESRSPYKMVRGREYLIPLAEEQDGWRTVYDRVPQTEFTSDGGAVYYNGWSSLDTGGSQTLIYPQSDGGDHFYDRMMYAEKGDISALIDKWTMIRS